MNEERRVGRKIAHLLSEGCTQLDPAVLARLREARRAAVAARRRGWLDMGRALGGFGGLPALRPVLTAMLVLAVFLAGEYLNAEREAAKLREVETALLADDLPIDAYLDKGFQAWLRTDSRS